MSGALWWLLPPLAGLLVALVCADLLILAYGGSPLEVYRLFLAGTWTSPYGIGQVLFKATPLILTGLSVAVALEAGLLNVGAEGQLALGAFAMGLVGTYLPPATPGPLAIACCLGAGFLGGAAAGALAGALKAWRGAHEVIVTIMLNFIILAKLSDVGKVFYLRESVHTPPIVPAAALGRASDLPLAGAAALRGSALNGALLVALGSALVLWWLLARTAPGFRLRAVGQGAPAAEAAGIPVGRQMILALGLAGGLSGLVGANAVLGYKHYYEEGFSGGIGFMGIAVALVGRSHPAGIVLAALLFGTLSQGGLAVNAVLPKEIVDVLEGVIILAVAAAAAVASGELRRVLATTGTGSNPQGNGP
ncbi:MAG TPA: ABC transporter permease [Polyangia bacterium]|nr:ABC transporter permease [Polyangia bacterium]